MLSPQYINCIFSYMHMAVVEVSDPMVQCKPCTSKHQNILILIYLIKSIGFSGH